MSSEVPDIIAQLKNVSALPSEISKSEAEQHPPKINWLRRCGVPIKYEAYSMDSYQGNSKLVGLLKSCVHTADNITLFGNTGCGKTHLAVGMLAEFIKQNTNAFFIIVTELLLRIRTSFSERSTLTEDEIIDQYTAHALLVLDDLGAEKTSDFSITTLYLIIDTLVKSQNLPYSHL
jgi:DNA replication protein DnaC